MAGNELDIDALIRGRRAPRRRSLLIGGAIGLIGAAALTYFMLRGGEAPAVIVPTEATATLGQLSTTVDLSGSAAAAQYRGLSFGVSGEVLSVEVAAGDVVEEGQLLARLDTQSLELAVKESEVNLTAQQANLSEVVGGSSDPATASKVANARQSVIAAQTRVSTAEDALNALVRPDDADVAAAEAAMIGAEAVLEDAQDQLALLQDGPTSADRASADLAVASAQSRLIAAASAVVTARNVDGVARTVSEIVAGNSTTTAEQLATLILQNPKDPLVTGAALTSAEAEYLSAKAQLQAAIADRDELLAAATPTDLAAARSAVTLAQQAYDEARATAERLAAAWRATNAGGTVPPDDATVRQARAELTSAEAGLTAANADLADLLDGADASSVAGAQLSVVRAEQSLLEARAALDAADLVAPFAGTVQSVSIAVGDTVTATTATIELLNEAAIEVQLTVTESDLPDIEVGQIGLATFDAIDNQQYPVRISTISKVPETSQGVVTYPVTATLLQGTELADAADSIAVLQGESNGAAGGGFPGGGGAGGAGGPFAGIELPDGVSMQDVLQALANNEPLPDGVTLPDGFEIPDALLERLRAGGGAGGQPPTGQSATGSGAPGGATQRPMPAPGMSGSVTILTEVRDEALLIPVSAVRLIDDVPTVRVPGEDGSSTRVEVTLGSSDGSQVEVLSGLEAGAIVLEGAETEGVPYTATTRTSNATQGQGFFFGGGPPPGFNGGGAP